MGKGGQNNTYKINGGGGKGSARDSAPSRGSGDMTRFLLLISRITFFGGKALVSQYLSAMYSCKGTYIHSMLQEKKIDFLHHSRLIVAQNYSLTLKRLSSVLYSNLPLQQK